MKKINNPFPEIPDYCCFGCSPDNPNGLKMEFFLDGDDIVCYWEPQAHLQGWQNVLHGGIQATLMDEIASWWVFASMKTSGVTSRMDVRLKKTVYTNKGKLMLKARLLEMKRNIAVIRTELYSADGVLSADADISYFTYEESVAKEKLWYPGHEKFIVEE